MSLTLAGATLAAAGIAAAAGGASSTLSWFSSNSATKAANKLNKQALEHSIAMDNWNKDYQERSFAYQQYLNNLTMQREDTAVQRHTKDLQAAGFNPILAAGGSGASSQALRAGSVSPLTSQASSAASRFADAKLAYAQQKQQALMYGLEVANAILDMRQKRSDISKTEAEEDYIRAQTTHESILNEHTGKIMGLQISQMEFELEASKSKLPLEIGRMTQDLTIGDQTIVLNNLKADRERIGITTDQLLQVRAGLENNEHYKKLKQMDQEIMLNAVAIELKTEEKNQYFFKAGRHNAVGLAADEVFSKENAVGSALSNAAYSVEKRIEDVKSGKVQSSGNSFPRVSRFN